MWDKRIMRALAILYIVGGVAALHRIERNRDLEESRLQVTPT